MAKFNPDINPTQAPNFLGASQALSQPSPVVDSSIGSTLKGIGDTLGIAAKGIDASVKSVIDDKLYTSIDAERDQYSQVLNSTKSAITGTTVDDPAHPMQLNPEGEFTQTKPPQYVDDSLKAVARASGAAEAGKLSPTAYYARLNSIAKDLRSQFPGWRDYIDTKISGITGVTPANAYISSITSDINAFEHKKNDEHDKLLTMARSKEMLQLPNGNIAYQKVLSGEWGSKEYTNWVNPILNRKYKLDMAEAERKNYTGNREVKGDMTADVLTQDAATAATNYFDGVVTLSGLTSPQKIGELITKAQTGQIKLDDTQADQLGRSVQAQKKVFEAEQWRKWNTPDPETKRTPIQDLGKDGTTKAQTIINNQSKLFDLVTDGIYNKDYGSAFGHMAQSKRMLDDTAYSLYSDKDMGAYNRTVAALARDGSPEVVKLLINQGMLKDISGKMKDWANNVQMGIAAQPDLRDGGKAKTILGALQAAKQMGIKDPKVIDDITRGNIKMIVDPKIPDKIKLNVAEAAYSPEDRGLIQQFGKDTTDPLTGKFKPGRMSVFTAYVNPAISNEMWRMKEQYGDETIWTKYKTWAEGSFASEIFNSEINDLHTIQTNPFIQITWDDVNKRFGIKPIKPPQSMVLSDVPPSFFESQKAINRLNQGLSGIKSIAEKDGGDVDGYLINLLIGMGYNPSQGRGANMPEAMVNAIAQPRIREMMQKKLKEQNQAK